MTVDQTYNWQLHDKVNRLEISRQAALTRRVARWSSTKTSTESAVRAERKESITNASTASIIDNPSQSDQLSNPHRQTKVKT